MISGSSTFLHGIFFTHWIALPLSAPLCVSAPTTAPGRPCVIPLLTGMRHLDALDARFGQDQRRRARSLGEKLGGSLAGPARGAGIATLSLSLVISRIPSGWPDAIPALALWCRS
jgi:hypothetical protein